MPPRSKNGSKISSLVSLDRPRDGGGSVEPVRRQTSSQNTISNAITISGGITRAAVSRAILPYFSARGGGFGVIATTARWRRCAGTTVTDSVSVSRAGIVIGVALRRRGADRASPRGPMCGQTSTRLIDSDFR